MIDVGAYLPHDAESDLVHIDASLKLTENLPVLDGAAALLPVYAAFVDAVYLCRRLYQLFRSRWCQSSDQPGNKTIRQRQSECYGCFYGES